MDVKSAEKSILFWLKAELKKSGQKGFVVGVSGGVDSAVVSTLCAKTGFPVTCLSLPIKSMNTRAGEHLHWLERNYSNVTSRVIDLTSTFDIVKETSKVKDEMTLVNTRARLRMVYLYMFSGRDQYLVAGTGNKIEDYGIGFFSKYGDGAVDLSPIGSLVKSDVYAMASYLKIPESIQKAAPSDDLWEDGRSDEDQIGVSYDDLEWALSFCNSLNIDTQQEFENVKPYLNISEEEERVLDIYIQRHEQNAHKMSMPPICYL